MCWNNVITNGEQNVDLESIVLQMMLSLPTPSLRTPCPSAVVSGRTQAKPSAVDKGSPIHNAQGFGKDVSTQCCVGGREGA